MSIEITITRDYDGVKPKNFIKKNIDVPFFKIVDLIKEKRITLNGKKIKSEDFLREGDVIKVWPHDIELRGVKREHLDKKDLGIDTIFEDENLLVLNKLQGVVVQGAQDNNKSISLHLAWYKDKIGDKSDFEYFHVHRLDKDTSGVLVVGKNKATVRDLNQIFRERDVVKKYICLCVGKLDKKEGEVEVYLMKNPEGSREKMSVRKKKDEDNKLSISCYKVIKEYEVEYQTFSLVEVEIKTGLTHQIRVHMKYLGNPILGDTMYGNLSLNKKYLNKLNRQFLHASHIEFDYLGKHNVFDAPLPKDLESFLKFISS